MPFSAQQAKKNLKSHVHENQMLNALDDCLIRYIDNNHPLLESITVCAKRYKVKKIKLEELVRECVPKEYIAERARVLRRKFNTGK